MRSPDIDPFHEHQLRENIAFYQRLLDNDYYSDVARPQVEKIVESWRLELGREAGNAAGAD